MNRLPLAASPKDVPDCVDDGTVGCPRSATSSGLLPLFGQTLLEFPPQGSWKTEVIDLPGCGSLAHKAHLLFENGDIGKPILGEMRLCSSFTERFSDRLDVDLPSPYS